MYQRHKVSRLQLSNILIKGIYRSRSHYYSSNIIIYKNCLHVLHRDLLAINHFIEMILKKKKKRTVIFIGTVN